MLDVLQLLHDAWFAAALRRATALYPFVNACHILAIGMVVGAVGILDLRLLGAFRGTPVGALAPVLTRVAAIGVTTAVLTGFLLFSVQPAAYAKNPAFLLKVGLVALGIANAVLLHRTGAWRSVCAGGQISGGVKFHAAASLAIWVSALLAGRWIAFVD